MSKQRFNMNLFGHKSEYEQFRSDLKCIDLALRRKKNDKPNTLDVLNIIVTKYKESLLSEENSHPAPVDDHNECTLQSYDENLVITTQTALQNFSDISYRHSGTCDFRLTLKATNSIDYGKQFIVTCDQCQFKSVWKSSLELSNGKNLVTLRMFHGYITSGMLPSQMDRFISTIGLQTLGSRTTKAYLKFTSDHISEERRSSCDIALTEELQLNGPDNSIDLVTDARHSTRRNSKFTDVACLGYNTKQVIHHEIVSRADDPCAQRHELLGTKRIYAHLETKQINVRRHGHDRNTSVSKYIRENQQRTVNQYDTWHASVSLEKQLKQISSGAKCREGKTWSIQLSDKVGPVKTHMQYAMRNCNGDQSILRTKMECIVKHYQNDHTDCSPESRCKIDPNYIPSRQILTSPVAVELLLSCVRKCYVYKDAQNYIYHMDTSSVESFNNSLNVFHDKRIGTFSALHYTIRSNLAICQWNETVQVKNNTRLRCTLQFKSNIWARYKQALFSHLIWRPF